MDLNPGVVLPVDGVPRYETMKKSLLCHLAAALAGISLTLAADKPNIVFILADDLGVGELGCYGQKMIRTPNIDRLANEGMRFTACYAGSAVCAPSRCSLLTGKHPGHAFVRDNRELPGRVGAGEETYPGQTPLPENDLTIAKLLRSAGYLSTCIGKWGLGNVGNSGDPQKQGFDHFFGYYCQRHAHNHYPRFLFRDGSKLMLDGNEGGATGRHYAQDQFIAEAEKFLRENKHRPFLLYLPVTIPHLAIQGPEEALAEYRGKFPEPEDYKPGSYFKHATPRAGYAGMVTYLDRGVGRILTLLDELKLDEKTLVLFSSDNGPTHDRVGGADSDFFKSSEGRRGRKGSLYEGGLRVPLLARWPGKIKPGTVSDHVCAFWDVLPTLGELAGVIPPPHLDGLSFAPTLLGREGQKSHEFLYWEFPAYGHHQALRAGKWKAVRPQLAKAPKAEPELYDLAADPGEAHDVADQNPEVVERLRALMVEARNASELFPLKGVDAP
ncbi:MAG: arylsulfatase [Verrucomicrobiales bacterium]